MEAFALTTATAAAVLAAADIVLRWRADRARIARRLATFAGPR